MDLNARNEDWERQLRSIFRKVIYLSEQHLAKWVLYYVMKTYDKFENKATRIAVVGGVVSGKSSLINALIGGENVCPTDNLPWTFVPISIQYAPNKRAFIKFSNPLPSMRTDRLPANVANHLRKYSFGKAYLGKDMQIPPLEIPFDEIKRYVCYPEWTQEEEKVWSLYDEIEISVPNNFLKNKIVLKDSPGLNESNKSMCISLDCVKQSDAAIFLINARTPFTYEEKRFIEEALPPLGLKNMVMVVNKIDLIGRGELEEKSKSQQKLMKYITSQVWNNTSIMKIFSISACQAIEAKAENNSELLEESGIPKLSEFLTEIASKVRTQRNINCSVELKSFLSDHVISNIKAVFLDDKASPLFESNYLQNLVIELEALIAEMENSQSQEI